MTYFIGIGGLSRAGKTSLAYFIQSQLLPHRSIIIHQDNYPNPERQIPRINELIDWEHPQSLNELEMLKDIHNAALVHSYIIIEGIFAFAYPQITKLYHCGFEVQIDKECFLERKNDDHRWGIEPHWYKNHIWDSHFKYRLITEQTFPFIIVNGKEAFDKSLLNIVPTIIK